MEAVNKVIVSELKKRLNVAKDKWVEELPHVLWTYRTTPRRSTGETHFSMIYGVEAVIPLETGFPTSRTSSFNPKDNDEQLAKSLDLIEEKRENAMVQLAYYQQKLKQGYDANVKLRPLTLVTWCYVKLWALQRIQLGESYDQIGKDHIVSPQKLALEHIF